MSWVGRVLPVGLASLVLGAIGVLYLRPEVVLSALPDLEAVLAEIEPVVFLIGAVAMLGVAATAVALRAKLYSRSQTVESTTERTESAQSLYTGPEAMRGQLGAGFDTQFRTATDYSSTDRTVREDARTDTIEDLRALAQETYRKAAGCDVENAAAAVESGEWTTDERAAGLLADESEPSIPLRLYAWDLLVGRDPYVNSVDHTLSALEALADFGLHGEEDQ